MGWLISFDGRRAKAMVAASNEGQYAAARHWSLTVISPHTRASLAGWKKSGGPLVWDRVLK